ncbi:6529_t:CDS:1 [Gigaspora margarita]|uniref:6529_t:CDS:1 n=2 Tax=Gigaspora margarita TaxID=4874 RepID=A0ABN7WQD9_GIGMA|nr:mannose-P-dolichol utilization defect 1 protein [Gigaspora margarita]CAG8838071.1 6529_t:CDS:1 [Gigaspora margarita]
MVQLPDIIKYPAVNLIGETCYTSLVENLNISDTACLKLLLSKGLGIGIILAGSIVKLPQIIKILTARSTRGLSFESVVLETCAFGIGLAYNLRNANPFSTFGETFFLTIQNVIILFLMLHYANRNRDIIITCICMIISTYSLGSVDLINDSMLAFLQTLCIPLALFSKIPQIFTIYKNGSTGQLSSFAIFGFTLGSLARVFTTLTEVDDDIILVGFLLTSVCNCILAGQMIYYWDAESKMLDKKEV